MSREMTDDPMAAVVGEKRPHYRPTTADQRKLAFAVYQQTASPRKACEAAHIGRGTFNHWLPRFLAGGYAALEQPGSHRPPTFPRQLPDSVLEAVLATKREPSEWGKRRIADELAKAPGSQPLVSASEVRRTLIEAGLWHQVTRSPEW